MHARYLSAARAGGSNRCLACAPCQGTAQPISERPDHAAVAQRQSNRFVSDRLTVRIRPAAPADFPPVFPSNALRRAHDDFASQLLPLVPSPLAGEGSMVVKRVANG